MYFLNSSDTNETNTDVLDPDYEPSKWSESNSGLYPYFREGHSEGLQTFKQHTYISSIHNALQINANE